MSMLKTLFLLNVVLALGATGSFAGDGKGDGKDQKPTPGQAANAKTVTWEEFRARCESPDKFPDVQRAPQNIILTCRDERLNWMATPQGEITLPTARTVVVQVSSDKFQVSAEQKAVEVQSNPGTCNRYKQVLEKIAIEKSLSCADITGMKGDLTDLCVGALDGAKAGNPKVVEVTDTGKAFDTCGTVGIVDSHDGGKGDGKNPNPKP
jgi:hypothetical protein